MSETTVSLTEHEILALLAFNDTEPAAYTRDVLRLSGAEQRETLVRAGLATLLVREQAALQGENLVLQGAVQQIAGIMATAGGWLEVAVTTAQTSYMLFAVQSTGGSFIMSAGTHGVHSFDPMPQDKPILLFALDIAKHYLEATDPGSKVSVRAKHHGLGTETRVATLLRDTDGTVRLALDDGPGAQLTEPTTGHELEEFARALALDGR